MPLRKLLIGLQVDEGCYPCIAYRGAGIWRAHVNGAGNFWAEDKDPLEAMMSAIRAWHKSGNPLDGYASQDQTPRKV